MFNITQEEELQSNLLQQTSSATSAPTESENDCFALATTKKRNLPGNPDPDAEVIALSPRSLMATNRYTCEICHKGFRRDQNLQLHRRGHNLPWKLKQRLAGAGIKKRVYVCPQPGCIHHDPTRALGDLTGIKKHFCRKHGEKKWKCEKCCKCYAVQSDWKAHGKICGTREYHCDCGTIFSRKDSFITHRAFCDALAEENYKVNQGLSPMGGEILHSQTQELLPPSLPNSNSCSDTNTMISLSVSNHNTNNPPNPLSLQFTFSSNGEEIFEQGTPQHPFLHPNPGKTACLSPLNVLNNTHMAIGSSYMSATAMLQKAAVMGSTVSDDLISPVILKGFTGYSTTLRSYGSVLGPKNASPTPTSSSVVGNQNEFENYFEYSNMDFGPPSVLQGGLMDSPMSSKPGHHNQLVGAERMTLDFLGLRPLENLSIGNQSCVDGDTGGLRYSDEERNLHSMHSHHHISHDQTTMENPMWNF